MIVVPVGFTLQERPLGDHAFPVQAQLQQESAEAEEQHPTANQCKEPSETREANCRLPVSLRGANVPCTLGPFCFYECSSVPYFWDHTYRLGLFLAIRQNSNTPCIYI